MLLSGFAAPAVFADPLAAPLTAPPNAATRPVARPSWDLDGTYLWLGPLGAAAWTVAAPEGTGSRWDSVFGADMAVVRVRQRNPVGVIGISAGANRSTRHEGRLWLDAVVGTSIAGHMVGISLGPIVGLSSEYHPRLGGSIRIWGFAGIAPYARLGVAGADAFLEIGLQIPLPVLRR